MARVIAEDVKNDPTDVVIVEGIRRLADIATLKDLPNFYLVSVDAAPELRYQRLVKRNENIGDADKTFEQFLADQEREAEIEIPVVMAQAKYHLNNNGTLAELYKQIDKIIADINNQ
jgi:dephospho-CoA kinase